jgi:hypothetical protein
VKPSPIDFLKALTPEGFWVLTAISRDGPAITRTFSTLSEGAAREFVRAHAIGSGLEANETPLRANTLTLRAWQSRGRQVEVNPS